MKRVFLIFLVVVASAMGVFAQGEGWLNPTSIKTYIPPKHHNTLMMKHAFERWSKVTKNKIIFVYTNDSKQADMEVVFLEKINNAAAGGKAIGLTHRTYIQGKKIVHATVYIADKSPNDNSEHLDKDIIFTTMLHEIGHALGLEHVDDPNAIMNPYADVIMEISDSDMKQLYRIYNIK